ncbi:LysR substrate-binding domain-containing protein [Lichenicoccus sp.]|uniref:LysR family transcriptional regulator n=1 Tax=Lichenicoccus sp. TaxID=2781899 RepID=UPI003D0ABF75
MDRLLAMESFVRTVEHGSFAAAAAGQGLSPSMVGNHVRFLEKRLGALLLNRTTRQQSLTAFGRAYHEECRRILIEIQEAESQADLARTTPRGLLRVTTPMALGTTIMPEIVAAYLRRFPDVHVELVLQDQRLDLLAEGLDVAIRVGALPDSGLIGRALPPLRLIACASPSYLLAHGRPRAPAELQTHNCLDFTYAGEPRRWRFTGPQGDVVIQISGNLRINNGQALRAAALEHLGVILQPEVVVAEDVAAGRLVPLLADYVAPSLPVHLLTQPDRHESLKLRRFVELAVDGFKCPGLAEIGDRRTNS